MPEHVVISVLQGHFPSPHPTGTSVSVPTPQGKLRHRDGMICSWSHKQTVGEEQWRAGFLGTWQHEEQGTKEGVVIPCEHQTLGC